MDLAIDSVMTRLQLKFHGSMISSSRTCSVDFLRSKASHKNWAEKAASQLNEVSISEGVKAYERYPLPWNAWNVVSFLDLIDR